jgi:hypothetical protein
VWPFLSKVEKGKVAIAGSAADRLDEQGMPPEIPVPQPPTLESTCLAKNLKTGSRNRLFEFAFGGAGLRRNHGRGDDHSDKGKTNQEIVHGSSPMWISIDQLHTSIMSHLGNF